MAAVEDMVAVAEGMQIPAVVGTEDKAARKEAMGLVASETQKSLEVLAKLLTMKNTPPGTQLLVQGMSYLHGLVSMIYCC